METYAYLPTTLVCMTELSASILNSDLRAISNWSKACQDCYRCNKTLQRAVGKTQDRYALRNAENIPLPIARSQLYNSSFLPATIRDWNALPLESRNANSVQVFRHKLLTHKSKHCALFCVVSRIGQILHARLCLCCSSLNYDLFRKNITDSSLCTCNQVETAAHFLLYCPLYNRQRQLFFTTFHVHQQ